MPFTLNISVSKPARTARPRDLCVVIPVFNEARFIGDLARRLRPGVREVIVVDDGSTDGSGALASRAGATVLTHSLHRGKGAALSTGFRYATSRSFQAIVTMDGDLQHVPEELGRFVDCADLTGADVVIGVRRRDPARMPWLRRMVNSSNSALISFLTGQRFRDVHCGYRWFRTDVLRRIRLESERFDAEIELLAKATRMRCAIREVPVRTVYGSETSKIRPLADTLRFFRALKYLWA